MPYKITKYNCSNCNKTFDTYEQANNHELKCNKCNSCKNGYCVYGCEFDCRYLTECKYPYYKKFERKTNK